MITLLSIFLLIGCSNKFVYPRIVNSKIDENGFVSYFELNDLEDNVSHGSISVSFNGNYYFYSHVITDTTIEIIIIENDSIEQKISFDGSGNMIIEKRNDQQEIISQISKEITRDDFIELYIKQDVIKLNLDFSKLIHYEREESVTMHTEVWWNFFRFDDTYLYQREIFDINIEISNLQMKFQSPPTSLEVERYSTELVILEGKDFTDENTSYVIHILRIK